MVFDEPNLTRRPVQWRSHSSKTRRGAQFLTSILGVALLYLFAVQLTSADTPREYDIKAVFLYNFTQFVEWPSDAFPASNTPVTIGILGTDPFGEAIDEAIRNETVRGRRVIVERYRKLEEIKVCHVLFIANSEYRRVSRILTALQGRPTLTVAESENFARQGGMIRLYTENSKVHVNVNNEAARAAHLVISSKLLRIVNVVTPASPPPAK